MANPNSRKAGSRGGVGPDYGMPKKRYYNPVPPHPHYDYKRNSCFGCCGVYAFAFMILSIAGVSAFISALVSGFRL